jgi:hypothetical protein
VLHPQLEAWKRRKRKEAASLQLVIMEDDSSSDELQSLSDTSLASSLADSGESGGVMRMGA